jgi:hypothetical protein
MFHGKLLSSEHVVVLPIELTGFRGFVFGFCLEGIFIKFQRWGQFLTLFLFSILHYFVYIRKNNVEVGLTQKLYWHFHLGMGVSRGGSLVCISVYLHALMGVFELLKNL